MKNAVSRTLKASHTKPRASSFRLQHFPYCVSVHVQLSFVVYLLSVVSVWLSNFSSNLLLLFRGLQILPYNHTFPVPHWLYLYTYLLTPWCRVLLEKLTGLQLVKKFPVFHGTRRFITALTSVHHLSPSLACCAMFPLETLPPGDTSGGVVYLRIVLSPEESSPCECFLTFFTRRSC